ncbi:MAG: iron-containing alcohol dehydrogenase [Actinomycetota bacterium]|nr:iron-containing alcohol dehydrogenase [Actinomycetota bacterium]
MNPPVEFPQVQIFDSSSSEDEASKGLAEHLNDLNVESPFVLSSIYGRRLASHIKSRRPPESPRSGADQQWALDLGSRARRSGADAIVAIGGGRCIDVAKLAAARAGLALIAVPTQLSHDGICSPVAVVPDHNSRAESVGAIPPRAVFISLPTLAGAPSASVRAGIGDLLANPLALKDWALAAEHGLEKTDQRAWDLSVESFQLIKPHLDVNPSDAARDPDFLRQLADALVLSGAAMIVAGTSRPASGGEHEISHAIDEVLGGRALHGAQVAFGCIISVALYGEDPRAFREQLSRLGLPQHPGELGLDEDQMVQVLLAAPDTRPGRFTIVEDADLDGGRALALVRRIWPE